MNVIGQPDVYTNPLQAWFDKNLKGFTETPIGELRIKWYTAEALTEQSGEIATIEKWNGHRWIQYGLDAHDTVQDLLDLNWKLANFCELCGADEMTANCNNAGCS